MTLTIIKSRERTANRRGAATRSKMLSSVITCLARFGYAATTTEAVMAEAGVSRGSVLHQFPVRLDMIEAAADKALHLMLMDFNTRAAAIDNPVVRLSLMPEIVWAVQNEPPAFAVTEVLLAARWDEALAAGFKPVAERIEKEIDTTFVSIAREAGVRRPTEIIVQGRLMIATLRGLAIELMFDPDRPMIHEALEAVIANHQRFVSELIDAAKGRGLGRSFKPTRKRR